MDSTGGHGQDEMGRSQGLDRLSDDALMHVCEFLSMMDVFHRFAALCRRTRQLVLFNNRIISRDTGSDLAPRSHLIQSLLQNRIDQQAEHTLREIVIHNASNITQELADRFFFFSFDLCGGASTRQDGVGVHHHHSQQGPIFANLTRLTLRNSALTRVRLWADCCNLVHLDLTDSKQLELLEVVRPERSTSEEEEEEEEGRSGESSVTRQSLPLTSLILDGCDKMFMGVDTASSMPLLQHASFARSTWMGDSDLEAFLQYWPLLRMLNLRACKGVGDISMYFVAHHLPQLEVLILDYTSIGDQALKTLADVRQTQQSNADIMTRPLQELSLSGCRLTNRSISELERFNKLEKLSLCRQNVDLLEPLASMRHIHHLNLAFVHINDDHLASLVRSLDGLESLNLSFCKFITDDSMRHIADTCHSLRWLDISNARRISDIGLRALTDSTVLRLRYLHCSNCSPTLTRSVVDEVKKKWQLCIVRFVE